MRILRRKVFKKGGSGMMTLPKEYLRIQPEKNHAFVGVFSPEEIQEILRLEHDLMMRFKMEQREQSGH